MRRPGIPRQTRSRRSRSNGQPTIADVAAQAGVAAITASRALRTPHLVSAALREKIAAAVQALDYVPNVSARALASNSSEILGVLIPSLIHSTFTDVLRGIYDGVADSALQVQIGNTRYDPAEEERLVELFLRRRPAAMIVSGTGQTPAARAALAGAGCPVVQIMDLTDDPIDTVVGFSHARAGRLATEHLIAQGYRRIAFLGGWMNPRSMGRLMGYRQALAEAGLPEPCSVHSLPEAAIAGMVARAAPGERPVLDFARPGFGRELLRQALAQAPNIDAVFCNNDGLALGALFECRDQGIDVPGRLGIAGFNDLDFAEAAAPALSSVRTHRYRTGQLAVETILARLAGDGTGPRVIDLGVEVMPRQSTDRQGRLTPG